MMDFLSFRSKILYFYDFWVWKLCKYIRMGTIIISQPKIMRDSKWGYYKNVTRKENYHSMNLQDLPLKYRKLTLFIVLSTGIFYLDHGERALQRKPNKGKTWQNENESCQFNTLFSKSISENYTSSSLT